jgi:hypothetical protein
MIGRSSRLQWTRNMTPTNGKHQLQCHAVLPEGATLLPTIWQFKRKRDLCTSATKKHKARLCCLDGSKQRGQLLGNLLCASCPWNSIRALLIVSLVHGWHAKQLDCVQAFPQAPPETQLHLSLPSGICLEGGNWWTHVMKVLCNVCGRKQAGRTFKTHLASELACIRFKQPPVNLHVFCKGKTMHVLPTHDSILEGPDLNKRVKLDIAVEG